MIRQEGARTHMHTPPQIALPSSLSLSLSLSPSLWVCVCVCAVCHRHTHRYTHACVHTLSPSQDGDWTTPVWDVHIFGMYTPYPLRQKVIGRGVFGMCRKMRTGGHACTSSGATQQILSRKLLRCALSTAYFTCAPPTYGGSNLFLMVNLFCPSFFLDEFRRCNNLL
jgi:hypothetical protein